MKTVFTAHGDLPKLLKQHRHALSTEYGPTSEFWSTFLEMTEILFAFIRSLRVGIWKMHLAATKRMLPWLFAYDRQNYARYLSLYLAEMTQLPETHPGIYEEFMYGIFIHKNFYCLILSIFFEI